MLSSTLSRAVILLALAVPVLAAGCQKENGTGVKEKPAAGFQQVKVELTGLT
jgi:hypothetical protein